MIGIESKFSAREISLRETERTNDRLKSRVSPPPTGTYYSVLRSSLHAK